MKDVRESGMSLVEVMLAASLMGGLAVVGMNLFQNQNKAQKTVEDNFEVTTTLSAIRGILANRDNCARNLRGKAPIAAANVITQITKMKDGVDITPDVYPINTLLPGTQVKITSYALSKSYSNLASDETMLVIGFTKGKETYLKNVNKTVKISYTVDGSGNIDKCFAVTSGETDSLWQIATNLDDIYYNSGNVGIGTDTPTSKLDVAADGAVSATITGHGVGANQRGILNLQKAGGTIAAPTALPAGQFLGTLSFRGFNGTTFTPYSSGISSIAAENFTTTAQGSRLHFYTTPVGSTTATARMTVSENGNVGIGETAPTYLLDVNGDIRATNLYLGNTNQMLTWGEVNSLYMSAYQNLRFYIDANNGSNDKFIIHGKVPAGTVAGGEIFTATAAGNVGIGTTAPTYLLDVNGDIRATNMYLGNTNQRLTWGEANSLYMSAAQHLRFYINTNANSNDDFVIHASVPEGTVGSGELLTVKTTGKVGIGTTAPEAKLHVASGDSVTNVLVEKTGGQWAYLQTRSSESSIKFSDTGDFSIGPVAAKTDNANLSAFKMNALGNSAFGSAPIDTYKLRVFGHLQLNSTSTFYIGNNAICTNAGCVASSDRRLKENIKPLKGSLEKILSLQGVEYDFKDKQSYGNRHHLGLIAQDVEKIFPEVVLNDKISKFKSLSYDNLVAPIIESIKSLFQKIFTVETLVHSLKKENQKLKDEVSSMKKYLCSKEPRAEICF